MSQRAFVAEFVPMHAYRIETHALRLANGRFPGLVFDRIFLKMHNVDGLGFLEFQRPNGSRHVMVSSETERAFPIGRATALSEDSLRLNRA
jgi:hypothetical protein